MYDKARRRHSIYLAKGRARRYACFADFPPTARTLGLRATSPKSCSCWMCGNPRRYHGGPTRQELLAADRVEGL